MARNSYQKWFLILPMSDRKFKATAWKSLWSTQVETHKDIPQLFVTTDESIALAHAKRLSTIFADDPIMIFEIKSIVEATGKRPYIVKTFNEKGELIPIEAFDLE